MTEEYRLIPVGRGGLFVKVSPEDFDWLNQWSWFTERVSSSYGGFYARRNVPRAEGRGCIKMHRQIMGLTASDSMCCDHINHDGLDNRRSNLRICTRSENNQNSRARSDSVSGLRGAYLHKPSGRYMSRIKAGEKLIYLGYFGTAEAAHAAYCEAAKVHHGEFAIGA